ncbi:MAG TPA: L-threonylcarbamoyladenylate synthase [Candidatus Humimicrobiaceae bacterium]|nr:L-threonylcarbamoyladenylate synthase [Candidatus Humimicrobiaceae bacterium]
MTSRIAEELKKGKVIICPTDTVYGLIADATNEKAVEKVFKIKKRPRNKALPIFVKNLKMAKKFAQIDKNQEKFLKSVWFTCPNFSKDAQKKMVKIGPKSWAGKGKVTVILKPKRKFPKGIGKPKKEIGLRIPNYKTINQLLSIINRPLTGTSANISGKAASTKIKEVLKQFRNQKYQPDLVVSAGNLPKSRPSLVIDLTREPLKILRA